MPRSRAEGFEEPEGPGPISAQLLSKLEGPRSHAVLTAGDTGQEIRESRGYEASPAREAPPFEIIPPVVLNSNNYKYLPGHFAVRRILELNSTAEKPLYTVRLQSGERETMTHDRFMGLHNSTRALEQYDPNSDSDDDLILLDRERASRRSFFGADGAASDDSDYPGAPVHGNLRRLTARGRYSGFYQIERSTSDKDDSDQESSTDELTEPQPRTRNPRRGPGRTGAGVRGLRRGPKRGIGKSTSTSSSDEYSPPVRATRVSGRDRKSLRKNLRERFEDDVSEAASDAPKQQKYAGARETFRKISHDDEFRQRHFACCDTCSYYEDDPKKGPLVFCQGCSASYHQTCLGPRSSREHLVTKVDEGHFILQCRRCLGIAHSKHDISPHLGRCAVCHEEGPMAQPLRARLTSKQEQQQRVANGGTDPVTLVDMARVDNIDNVLFRCTGCHRAFHVEHLPPMDGQDPSDNFSYYSTHWQCHECSDAPGEIHEILAWRLLNPESMGNNVPHAELIPEIDKEYLIKWKRKSYFRVVWMRGDWVFCVSNPTTRRSFYSSDNARKPIPTTEEAVSEDKLRVDIVFEVAYLDNTAMEDKSNPRMVKEAFVKYKGLNYEDSVWEEPPRPTEEDRWADFETAFKDWLARSDIQTPDRDTLKDQLAIIRTQNFQQNLLLYTQSDLITGGDLMEYQMDGVNWLYYMFVRQQNAILADDMGLGKTIQVIGLLATLIEKHACWPFLVCCPNATVPNWRREIKNWAPSIQVVTYFGTQYSRQMARDYEMFPRNGKDLHCHVVIASYESMIDDEAKRVLNKVPWAGLVVDEGQRLKNDKSQLYERLCRMKFGFKVLLTGTPLQNNIRELFNLLQFLDREKNAEALEEEYSMLDQEKIRTLHEMIRPFFLRRTKAEALPFLPPMVQIIVPVSMSLVQKKLYKSILGKNPQLIRAIVKKQAGQIRKQDRHNLNNILMQLRKCLCHPFIYNRAIEEYTNDAVLAQRHLVEASGKLRLLDLMLPKLHERGHRVLIFSQFLENLDIVEDFLSGLALKYCRLDGKLAAKEKQQQIDKFNEPDSQYFAFLLSTRSGGVGINLATADTVIIMDPDFNPKQDMQALSRAHRIGQQKTVLVFHLTTRASVEEKIMQKGKKKLALDHVLIERMEADEDEENLESILQHGAASLFSDDDSADIHYDSASIDKLLDRGQVEKAEHVPDNNDSGSAELPKFNFARVWQNDRGTLEEVSDEADASFEDVNAWDKILREREQDANEEENRKAEGLGRGKRKRATINYQTIRDEEAGDLDIPDSSPVKPRNNNDSDVEFRQGELESESADDEDAAIDALDIDLPNGTPPRPKVRPFKRVQLLPPSLDGTLETDPPMRAGRKCIACSESHLLGACPLKQAGVENCPLCGLAHFGKRRSCPHFHSSIQIERMLLALSKSQEDPKLVSMATKYLRGIVTSNAQLERRRAAKAATTSVTPDASQPMRAPEHLTATTPNLSQTPPMGVFQPMRASHQLPTTAPHPRDSLVPIDLTGPDSPASASNNDVFQPPPPQSNVPTQSQLPP